MSHNKRVEEKAYELDEVTDYIVEDPVAGTGALDENGLTAKMRKRKEREEHPELYDPQLPEPPPPCKFTPDLFSTEYLMFAPSSPYLPIHH
jgi:hypothetical protein